jgi:hypothetical protein
MVGYSRKGRKKATFLSTLLNSRYLAQGIIIGAALLKNES